MAVGQRQYSESFKRKIVQRLLLPRAPSASALSTDIYSRKVVGWDVLEEESMDFSSEKLIAKACASERVQPSELVLHSDNGGPMKDATMLATLERLGIAASFSRPRPARLHEANSLISLCAACVFEPGDSFRGETMWRVGWRFRGPLSSKSMNGAPEDALMSLVEKG